MDLDEIGTRVGTVPTVKSVDPLTGPFVAVPLIDRKEGIVWRRMCGRAGVLLVAALPLATARVMSTGWKLHVHFYIIKAFGTWASYIEITILTRTWLNLICHLDNTSFTAILLWLQYRLKTNLFNFPIIMRISTPVSAQ
ncbi:hypothetical protein ACQRIT_005005 [Beauveria bassiana]